MQIQVNTDGNLDGRIELDTHVMSAIESRLARFRDDVTRVKVHLADESAGRSTAADKRCMIEATLAWRSPVAVTSHSGTVDEALSSALDKLVTVLGREADRRTHHKGASSIRTDSRPPETPADTNAEADEHATHPGGRDTQRE